jgi:HD superfamily phosphohydrolase
MNSLIITEWLDALLTENKTIRDQVHGDIILNVAECAVIDTQIFQRLRRIKQLGTVDLVFPGAEHSRFQHSLGTLHVADLLVKNVIKNCPQELGEVQQKALVLVVRLAALLHDLYELPFSHTLEKEGHVFGKQWKDDDLNKLIFGNNSQLFSVVSKTIIGMSRKSSEKQKTLIENQWTSNEREKLALDMSATILSLVYKILAETTEELPKIVEKLFEKKAAFLEIFDEKLLDAAGYIIRNTICADLLDYLLRDFQLCGIEKKYDKRFLVYSTLFFTTEAKKRSPTVLFAYSLIDKRGRIKQSVLSSLLDVLELRYSLAEVVHTHRVKNAFSAMVIESFNLYYQSLDDSGKKAELKNLLLTMGDYELLQYLREKNADSKYVLDYYFEHHNYREFVLWDKWETVINSPALSEKALDFLSDASFRLFLEKTLVKWLNNFLPVNKQLRNGDILFYVMPNPEHLWKELEANVVYQGNDSQPKVGTLKSLSENNVLNPMSPMMNSIVRRIEGQRNLLKTKYCNLWRVSMFLSPKIDVKDDPDYSEIPNLLSDLVGKIFKLQGIGALPTEIETLVIMPEKLNQILIAIKKERRSFWTMEKLYEFPV